MHAFNVIYEAIVGFESGGECVFYSPLTNSLWFRASAVYDPNADQTSEYRYNVVDGKSTGAAVDSFPYDPRERPWYDLAKDNCAIDLLSNYKCKVVWSDFYVFAQSTVSGITAALGFTDSTGTVFAGVVGLDYTADGVNQILASATSNTGAVAYVMEKNGLLVGTSNGAAVVSGSSRINAQDSTDPIISSSSNYILDNYVRADQTLVVGDYVYTIKTFTQDSLFWYIVVVEDYVEAEDCQVVTYKETYSRLRSKIDLFLGEAEECGKTLEKAFFLGVLPYDSPSTIDLDDGIQDYMFALGKNYAHTIRSISIGFEDGAYIYYGIVINNQFTDFSFRPPDGSVSTTRSYYYINEDTGKTNTAAYRTRTYDPRGRAWYMEAKAAGEPIYSSVYVFASDGSLGMSYAVPIYQGSTLFGVVGIDFTVDQLDAVLEEYYGEPSQGVYIMETLETSSADAYDLVSTSTGVVVADDSAQFKAYEIEDVQDKYVADSAKYMRDNNFNSNGNFDMDGYTVTVDRYDERSLNWQIVSYQLTYPDTSDSVDEDSEGDGDGASNSEDDDDIKTVQIISEAIIALVVCIFVGMIVIIVMMFKGGSKDSASKPLTTGVALSDMSKA